jgi:hypothetical protein
MYIGFEIVVMEMQNRADKVYVRGFGSSAWRQWCEICSAGGGRSGMVR